MGGNESTVIENAVLEDMLRRSPACTDAGSFRVPEFIYEEDVIEWLCHNLPVLPYVVGQVVNFIFSNGITTGDEGQDKKLNDFLYAKNIKGDTNYHVLQEGVKNSLVYGKNGIRWLSLEDGILNVGSRHYASLTDDNEEYYGFKDTIGYIVSANGQKIWETSLDEIEFDKKAFLNKGAVIDKERKIIILPQSEFLNMRSNPSLDDGESRLSFDRQRLRLLAAVYSRMNYDIEYDGPGRILFKVKKGYASGDDNEVGTSEVVSQSSAARTGRGERARKEASEIGKQIKESTSDNVIVISDIFEDEIVHLPRMTKATEFFGYVENEGVILSQVFGIPPTLLGLGKISGNVSMEKIIDNAMLNAIIPMRELFATQISAFLAGKIGVDKIYFDKYEMQQAVDENDKRVKVVNMIEKLSKSGYKQLADKFAEMLGSDLENSSDGVKALKSGVFDKFKKRRK